MVHFGTDGVRGLANRDLTPEVMVGLGRAIARTLGTDRPLLIGRDTRRSGPMLEAALTAGFCGEGGNVEAAGPIPTPGLAWIAEERDCPAAMITASHNPFPDNGVKVFARGGRKLDDADQAAIEAALAQVLVAGPPPNPPTGPDVGSAARIAGAVDRYIVQLIDVATTRLDSMRIVLDCANGATFGAAPRVFSELGADVVAINVQPDGMNINEASGATDPTALGRAVTSAGAQLGLAFDGDGDRVIAVAADGTVVDGDALIGMHAFDLADRDELPGGAVVVTVMSNLGLRRALGARGIEVVETPVGDRSVVDALEFGELALGGEQSGHIIFRAVASTGDGILCGIRTAELMVRTGQTLAELAAPFVRVPQELRAIAVARPEEIDGADALWATVSEIERRFGGEGRVLVRASGTEPVVRVMVEHTDPAVAAATTDELVALVERTLA